MRPTILFVDENQDVLDGFKRVLFKMRKEWDMDFVSGAESALEKLEQKSYNAVISDINMYGLSGVQLFEIVRENHPEIARIFISESADMKILIEVLGTAHQFLVKPVDPQLLKHTLNRVMSLRNYLKDSKLSKLVNKIVSLPSQPEVHLQLHQAISTSSLKEIAKIIEQDPAITAKLLQLVNSPFLGIRERIESIHHAITMIGLDILNALVLSLEIFSKFHLTGLSRKELDEIYNHCRSVAHYARIIAIEITNDRTTANDAYIGGLLHDIGKVLILSKFNDLYFKIKNHYLQSQRKSDQVKIFSFQVEKEILGVCHAKLGAYLLALWGLPEILVETTAYHHNIGEYYCKMFSPVTAVHIADAVKRSETDSTNTTTELPLGLDLAYLEGLNMKIMEKIPALISKINELKNFQF
jgi:putative nucleotidyltransferase with HDIG domain